MDSIVRERRRVEMDSKMRRRWRRDRRLETQRTRMKRASWREQRTTTRTCRPSLTTREKKSQRTSHRRMKRLECSRRSRRTSLPTRDRCRSSTSSLRSRSERRRRVPSEFSFPGLRPRRGKVEELPPARDRSALATDSRSAAETREGGDEGGEEVVEETVEVGEAIAIAVGREVDHRGVDRPAVGLRSAAVEEGEAGEEGVEVDAVVAESILQRRYHRTLIVDRALQGSPVPYNPRSSSSLVFIVEQ